MVIDVGTHSAKPIEDCMKAYFNDHRNSVRRSRGTYNVECFRGPREADETVYFERFQAYVERNYRGILRYITDSEGTTKPFNGYPPFHTTLGSLSKAHGSTQQTYPWTTIDNSVQLACEMTKQIEVQEQTKQIEVQEQTKQVEAQEKTKQMQLEFEMMKLRASMNQL
jgi:hypothetical protein